jgi:hypothetical protein
VGTGHWLGVSGNLPVGTECRVVCVWGVTIGVGVNCVVRGTFLMSGWAPVECVMVCNVQCLV